MASQKAESETDRLPADHHIRMPPRMLPALTVSLLLLPPAVVVGSALPPSPLADPRPFAVPLLDHASSLSDAAAFERSATDELAHVEARYGGGRQAALSKRDSTEE